MEKKFLLVGALLLAGGFSTMNADVIYVTESVRPIWNAALIKLPALWNRILLTMYAI